MLSKTRLIVPPLSIDLFGPPLHGLILAVAEFTDDARFTGGSLVRTRRDDLLSWLAAYGIEPGETR